MNALDHIQVSVQSPTNDANARAVLREIETLLRRLVSEGKGGSIDLGSLPMTPDDFELLETVLGKGEVSAEVDSLGPTDVTETSIPGVWRVTHYNLNEEVMADFIEVTLCPDILLTTPEDVEDGLETLRAMLGRTTLMREETNEG